MIKFTRSDIKPAIQSLFICVAVLLSVIFGRYSMAEEIRVLLDYGCYNERMIINSTTYTITITEPKNPIINITNASADIPQYIK